MSENTTKQLEELLSKSSIDEINKWIAKYPVDKKQSAVMSALRIVQEEKSYLTSELMDSVAQYLDMPAIAVYEVARFYTMYEHEPRGRHIINVCTNISCKLNGSTEIIKYLQQKLGIGISQTTLDGRYSLRAVECLAACVNAPVMQIDKDYHENLSPDKINEILEKYQ